MDQGTGGRPVQSGTPVPILHQVDLGKLPFPKSFLIGGVVVAVVVGVMAGYLLSARKGGIAGPLSSSAGSGSGAASGVKTAGIKDPKSFPDCAKGQLEKGGLQGEGTHHLIREGGPSQTAYLLSSVVDLDQFAGKMVEVCGKSIASRRAPWLMDVGYVNVIE